MRQFCTFLRRRSHKAQQRLNRSFYSASSELDPSSLSIRRCWQVRLGPLPFTINGPSRASARVSLAQDLEDLSRPPLEGPGALGPRSSLIMISKPLHLTLLNRSIAVWACCGVRNLATAVNLYLGGRRQSCLTKHLSTCPTGARSSLMADSVVVYGRL